MSKLLEKEKEGLSFADINKFSDRLGSHFNLKFELKRMIEEDRPGSDFTANPLMMNIVGKGVFGGAKGPINERVQELSRQGLNMWDFFATFKSKENVDKASRMIADGASAKMLSGYNIIASDRIYEKLEKEPGFMKRFFAQNTDGVNLHALNQALFEQPEHVQLVHELVNAGASSKEFTATNLQDVAAMKSISSRLDPALGPTLDDMQRKGLSGTRLSEYVYERPSNRLKVVENLLSHNANVSRFKDQMSLQMFPESTASALVDASREGGMSVPEILGHLKKWSYGQHFYNLVEQHVADGKPLGAEHLKELATTANERAAAGVSAPIAGTEYSDDGFRAGSYFLSRVG